MSVRRVLVSVLCLFVSSCGSERQADRASSPADRRSPAERVAVVEGLAGPEGVRYDPESDVYFVSNFNGDPAGDANGFISRVGPDGAVLARAFMTGTAAAPLHGPRGLFLTGDTLWAADADGVHAFDRRSGAHLAFVDFRRFAPGFLNDIARGPDGALYITDTDRPRIFRLAGSEVSVALEDSALCGPNGIAWDESTGRFLTASWNRGPSVLAWRPGSAGIEPVGLAGPGGFDGLELVGRGLLVASQADSSIHELAGATEYVFLRLPAAPADFGVDTRRGRIAIPMMDRDEVEIWQLPPGGE